MWLTRHAVLLAAILALSGCGEPTPYYSTYPRDGSAAENPHPVSGPTIGAGIGGGG